MQYTKNSITTKERTPHNLKDVINT